MGQRGRKSAASLAVVSTMPGQRPEPPAELGQDEAHEWRAIVSRMPADWFGQESWPMLASLCRHIVTARSLSAVVDRFNLEVENADSLRAYDKLLTMRDRETKGVMNLSRQLRLTQQSRYHPKVAGTKLNGARPAKPWDDEQRVA